MLDFHLSRIMQQKKKAKQATLGAARRKGPLREKDDNTETGTKLKTIKEEHHDEGGVIEARGPKPNLFKK